jgi:antagonist of KipI
LELFSTERSPPSLLQAGDRVRFRAITAEEFGRLRGQVAKIDPSQGGQSLQPDPFLEIIRPGLLTTVQDLGRTGFRGSGVPLSGAMDAGALRRANLLVGNPEGAAALEVTLLGPELEFLQDALVAVEGAEFEGVKTGEALSICAGERLRFGPCARGCRAYLAVAGGVGAAPVLGSRSTYLRGGFGGFQGRALKAGDRLGRGQVVSCPRGDGPGTRHNPTPSPSPVVRAIRGAHAGEFGDSLFNATFKLSPQSDRMGLRLTGPAIQRVGGTELVSGAVAPGTVQIPPDGQPIVLAADAQTIGGYPQAAHVIAADLPLLGQLRPGDSVAFREVSLAEAHALLLRGLT